VRFKTFFAAVIVELIPELTIWLAQIGHAKSSSAGSASVLEAVMYHLGQVSSKPIDQLVARLMPVPKEIIDVLNEALDLFSNK